MLASTLITIVGLFYSSLQYTWPQLNICLLASLRYLIKNTLAVSFSVLSIAVDATVGAYKNVMYLVDSFWTCYNSEIISDYDIAAASVQWIFWLWQKLDEAFLYATMLPGWLSNLYETNWSQFDIITHLRHLLKTTLDVSSPVLTDVVDTTAIHYRYLVSIVENLQISHNIEGFINHLTSRTLVQWSCWLNPSFHYNTMLPCWIGVFLLGISIIGYLTHRINVWHQHKRLLEKQPNQHLSLTPGYPATQVIDISSACAGISAIRRLGKSETTPLTALSSCLKVRHMVNPGFSTAVWVWMVKDEILQRCFTSNKAQIVHIALSSQGCVYVMAKNNEEAAKVFAVLNKKWYFGNLVTVKYMREERYYVRFPDSRYKKIILKSLIE